MAMWDGAIGENENGSDGVDVLLNLSGNAFPVELVLLSVGEARGIEDANLGEKLYILFMFKNADTYHPAVLAREFVKADQIGPSLAGKLTMLVGVVKDVEVVVINVFPVKEVGEELQECRLSGTSLSNKKDGAWCISLILDEPLLERLYIAINYSKKRSSRVSWNILDGRGVFVGIRLRVLH